MNILANQKLEDILVPIGPYEHHQITTEIPEELRLGPQFISDWNYGAPGLLTRVSYPHENDIMKRSYWILKLFDQLRKRYGQLCLDGKDVLADPGNIKGNIFSSAFNIEFILRIGEATLNAFTHGNQLDLHKKIFIDSYLGDQGIVWTVTDQGNGFDVEELVKKFQAGEKHYKNGGFGFRSFKSENNLVAYNPKGNQWMWQYLFKGNNFKPIDQIKGEK